MWPDQLVNLDFDLRDYLVNLDFVLKDYLVNLDFVLRDYMRKMKIPDGLLELGYSKEDIPDLVKGAIPQVSMNLKISN